MNLFNVKVMSPIVDLSPGLLCHQCSDSLELIWSGEMGGQTAGLVISTVGQVASVQVLVAWVRLVCVLQRGRWDFGIMWWGVCLHVPALLADSEHLESGKKWSGKESKHWGCAIEANQISGSSFLSPLSNYHDMSSLPLHMLLSYPSQASNNQVKQPRTRHLKPWVKQISLPFKTLLNFVYVYVPAWGSYI